MKHESQLTQSSGLMADADNYNDYMYDVAAPFLRGRVLEVGCGVGSITKRLLKKADRLVSIDISDEALEMCRKKFKDEKKASFEKGDISNYASQENFDAIVCMNVIEHIEDDVAALKNMTRLLKPGGALIILVPYAQWMFSVADTEAGHYRRYSRKELENKMQQAINLKRVKYFNFLGGLGYFVVYKVLRKKTIAATSEISLFNKYLVGLARLIDKLHLPFGLSLVAVGIKEKNDTKK